MAYLGYGESAEYFGTFDAHCEEFQPWASEAGYELIETSYFGFSIPEAGINGEVYHMFHPNLRVASGGIFIFQGVKPIFQAADCVDYRSFMPMPARMFGETYPNGLRIDVIEPCKRYRIRFEDSAQGTKLDYETWSIMPHAVRPTGGHFTQAMACRGSLMLQGRQYEIDGYFTRDRSWGDPRTERAMPLQPLVWQTGVFDETFAFHVLAADTPEYHPDWKDRYPQFPAGANHLWGYVWRDGKLLGVKHVDQRTRRAADGLTPSSVDLVIEDEEGGRHEFSGEVVACLPYEPWNNVVVHMSLARWQHQGRLGWGDVQDIKYPGFVRHLLAPAQ